MALLAAVMIAAAAGGTAAAQEAATAYYEYTLTGGTAASSTLAGSEGGSFAYFRIAYPGNGADLRIRVAMAPYAAEIASAVGFSVYGPEGRVDTGVYQVAEGYLEVTYQEDEPADLLVQVYNYGTSTISYSIRADGLPQTAEAAAPSVEEPVSVVDTSVVAGGDAWQGGSGVVVGSAGGAFGEHMIQYTGDEEEVTVTVHLWPADPSFASAFGLHVYSPDGDLVTTALTTEREGVREATWASSKAGPYLLQVFNYSDGVTLTYTLEVTE